jgi:hypothetical protein
VELVAQDATRFAFLFTLLHSVRLRSLLVALVLALREMCSLVEPLEERRALEESLLRAAVRLLAPLLRGMVAVPMVGRENW